MSKFLGVVLEFRALRTRGIGTDDNCNDWERVARERVEDDRLR